jgi:hypothetical protein
MMDHLITSRSRSWIPSTLVVALVAAACCGCASESKKKWKFASWDVREAIGLKEKEPEKPEPETPTRLVATWTETVLNTSGEKPKRGFGGRIAFFTRDTSNPVRVDGQLVVYAFDETSRPSHETHPTRKFIFPAEEFVRHESESALGPAYSFWLPWDEVGGPQRNISLIARFEPRTGPIVIGEQTRHFLPGTGLDDSKPQFATGERSAVVDAVKLAGYSTQAPAAVPDLAEPLAAGSQLGSGPIDTRAQMSTATIALPQRLGNALQQNQHATSTYDAAATGATPLSQLSTMRSKKATPAAAAVAPTTAQDVPVAAPAASHAAISGKPIGAAGMASPGSLRDSLLGTLPAQARQSARGAPARAR